VYAVSSSYAYTTTGFLHSTFRHMGTLSYIKNFLKDKDVAAITPSSRFLVRRVCGWIDFSKDCIVVEYGPGTGVFSEYILEHMTDDSTLLLIESNEEFVEKLNDMADHDSRVIVEEERAENIADIMAAHDLGAADYVVSGIPFSFLDDDVKRQLIERTRDVLADDGKFLVYQNYNHMEEPLRRHFSSVHKEYEIRNIPPTYAYEAKKG
jgi:phospholipid N-methyltransferase